MSARMWLAAAVLALSTASAGADIVGKARVVDGDTIELAGSRIDLYGIDAPEAGQTCRAQGGDWACGREATFALAFEVGNHWVSCKEMETDETGRLAAVCYVGARDLGAIMVDRGWALAERRAVIDYVPQENRARQARRGLWRGRFVEPRAWRAGKRLIGR